MQEKLRQIMQSLPTAEPPERLEGLILARIKKENGFLKAKLWLTRAVMLASFGGAFYALAIFGKSFLHSEFWGLVQLAFSDAGVVAGHWSDFLMSLLETLPVANLVAIAAPIFVFFLTLSINSRYQNNRNGHFQNFAWF